jgi:hypothetical protein
MASKKNKNKQSGQLARLSQNNMNNSNRNNNAPLASAQAQRSNAPKVISSAKMTRIVHRELISTVNGNTTFNVDAFALNPGLSSTFPWLSSIAGSYEQYRFNKLIFRYVTRAPTTYIGSILMAPEYDAIDAAPSSEVSASQMNGAVEDSPWKDQVLQFNTGDMFPMGPRKYIRTGSLPTSSDLKTYDAGQLFLCEVSCADTSAIGKLWVEYDVELHIPQNPNTASSAVVGASLSYTRNSSQSLTTATPAVVAWNNEVLNGLDATNSSGVFTLPAGTFLSSGLVNVSASGGTGTVTIGLQVYQDGSVLSDFDFSGKFTESGDHILPFNFAFNSSSSTTIEVRVTVTSSVPTLVLRADGCAISITRSA